MRVGIVAQRSNTRAHGLAAELTEDLERAGETVALDDATATALDVTGDETGTAAVADSDLVVSIGGDGTFLYAANVAGSTPVMGINLGEVGFLNAVDPGNALGAVRTAIDAYYETGTVPAREALRLEATTDQPEAPAAEQQSTTELEWPIGPALNEVLVQATSRGRGAGLSVEVRVDGSLYTSTAADGVLVATPTGSTAYNLSEGGPLVHPGATGMIVTGMEPAEPMPPVVVGADSEVAIRVDDTDTVLLAADGSRVQRLPAPQWVRVRRTAEPARLAGPDPEFFQALSKLE